MASIHSGQYRREVSTVRMTPVDKDAGKSFIKPSVAEGYRRYKFWERDPTHVEVFTSCRNVIPGKLRPTTSSVSSQPLRDQILRKTLIAWIQDPKAGDHQIPPRNDQNRQNRTSSKVPWPGSSGPIDDETWLPLRPLTTSSSSSSTSPLGHYPSLDA